MAVALYMEEIISVQLDKILSDTCMRKMSYTTIFPVRIHTYASSKTIKYKCLNL